MKQRILLLFIASLALANLSFASSTVILRIMPSYSKINSESNELPKQKNQNKVKISEIIKQSFGIQGFASVFLGEHFALEAGSGIMFYKLNKNHFTDISKAYSQNPITTLKDPKQFMYSVPVSLMGQIYTSSFFTGIHGYIGAGYSASILFPTQYILTSIAHGPKLELGIDYTNFIGLTLNFKIAQQFMSMKTTYSKGSTKNQLGLDQNIKSSTKLNPVTISVGIGYDF